MTVRYASDEAVRDSAERMMAKHRSSLERLGRHASDDEAIRACEKAIRTHRASFIRLSRRANPNPQADSPPSDTTERAGPEGEAPEAP